MRAPAFVQLRKSSQAHVIRKNNVLILEKFDMIKNKTNFPNTNVGSAFKK